MAPFCKVAVIPQRALLVLITAASTLQHIQTCVLVGPNLLLPKQFTPYWSLVLGCSLFSNRKTRLTACTALMMTGSVANTIDDAQAWKGTCAMHLFQRRPVIGRTTNDIRRSTKTQSDTFPVKHSFATRDSTNTPRWIILMAGRTPKG